MIIRKYFLAALVSVTAFAATAQEDVATLRENARKFMKSGDMENAVVVLNRAYQADNNNMEIQKDLVMANFYKKDYNKALEYAKQLTSRNDVDVPSYQMAGNVYKALQDSKEGEKMYKDALKKFPNSGPLYSEYGELLKQMNRPSDALAQWKKGLELAPSYSGNYYNAALHYFEQPDDKIWAIIYGEIYANMESLSPRANVMKKMVLDAYKQKLFASSNLASEVAHTKNEFTKAVLETFAKQAGITGQGLTPETLAMIRTRFVLDWSNTYAKKFPFKLFDYQRQLMQDGLFDSYNQWMFGPVTNKAGFENWVNTHKENYDKFTAFHTSRIFKMPANQVYIK